MNIYTSGSGININDDKLSNTSFTNRTIRFSEANGMKLGKRRILEITRKLTLKTHWDLV